MVQLTNQSNSHTGGFLSSNVGAIKGCTGKGQTTSGFCGIKQFNGLGGGRKRRRSAKKRHRRKRRRRRSRSSKRRKRGGSTTNRLDPTCGMVAMLSRGENGTRSGGFSVGEKATLKGGYGPTPKTRKINIYGIQDYAYKGGRTRKKRGGVVPGPVSVPVPKTKNNVKFAGGGYGFTAGDANESFGPHSLGQGNHTHSTLPTSRYTNCGLFPKFKMGAGINYVGTKVIQKGAGHAPFPGNQAIPIMSTDGQNQLSNSNYGYTTGKNAAVFAPGHAQVTNLSHKQQCNLSGGRRKKKGGMTVLKHAYNSVMAMPGDVSSRFDQVTGDPFISVSASGGGGKRKQRKLRGKRGKRSTQKGGKPRRYRKVPLSVIFGNKLSKKERKKKWKTLKKRKRGKKQRGGYAQYQSNVPLTWTQQIPSGSGEGTWEGQLASPPTYTRTDICHNNYNHFTRKNTSSPVLDQAAP